ncbi:MAG: hypothetical protein LBH32_10340, partial [Dysgonamonadaceae bacterium]|nr:hypothetical protein [Dysgonamonadaceae bacterium]
YRSYAALFILRTSLPCAYAHGYKDTGATRLLAKHKVLQMIQFIWETDKKNLSSYEICNNKFLNISFSYYCGIKTIFKAANIMNITLKQPFSLSEAETKVKSVDNIYPNNQSIMKKNRLFITCGDNAGQVVCGAVQTYFHSFLDHEQNITPDFIEKAIRFGEISLDEFQKTNPDIKNPFATLCLIYFASNCIYFSQIGNSHIYQIRDNQIIYKSIDSSSDRKIKGANKPVEINIVKLKDIRPMDQFFAYVGDLSGLHEEETVCRILSEPTSSENKLSLIKEIYQNKTKSLFSAHLISIRNIENFNLKQKIGSLLYSFFG